MADSGYTKNDAAVGEVWSEAYADNLDNQIDELSRRFWRVDDQTWVTQNAVYAAGVWNREDTAKPAAAIKVDGSQNTITRYIAAAGANPIVWVDVAAKKIFYSPGSADAFALAASDDAVVSAATGVYAKFKEIAIPAAAFGATNGVYVSFDLRSDSGAATAYGKIYVGGSPVGTERTATTAEGWKTFGEAISSLSASDDIQIYAYRNDGGSVSVQNFRIYALEQVFDYPHPW